jgi:hypothetical protein
MHMSCLNELQTATMTAHRNRASRDLTVLVPASATLSHFDFRLRDLDFGYFLS